MLEASYQGARGLVAWENRKGLTADQDAGVAYKRCKATEAAARVQACQAGHPGAPMGLLGFCAGTAEAIFALEVLPGR